MNNEFSLEMENVELDGFFYVNSSSWQWCEYKGKPQTTLNVSIYYNDGQFIQADIKLDKSDPSTREIFFAVTNYFKGNLMWKAMG